MVMIFENFKKVDAFANVVWWSIYQQILKRIGQACLRTVLHGFLIDKLLTCLDRPLLFLQTSYISVISL
jgi:hypothetical protein